jgi:hypothetical protein
MRKRRAVRFGAAGILGVAALGAGAATAQPPGGRAPAPPGAARAAREHLPFVAPAQGLLSGPGDVAVSLDVPAAALPGSLVVLLDGAPLAPGALAPRPGGVAGTLSGLAGGRHRLRATATRRLGALRVPVSAETSFEIAALDRPEVCETLNAVHCLLPFPSSRFLEPSDATATGLRISIPDEALPTLIGPPLSAAPLRALDGFSPTAQVLMHFPGGLDLAASRAPVLLEARCCGQSPEAPYVGVRTQDRRSLEHDSPTVLLDADTGRRVLHWVELDARASDPARQALLLRPARSLVPGHRYVVAVRGLLAPDGGPVEPEPVFRALRDGAPSTIAEVEARRAHFEELFAVLGRRGIRRDDLVLAFDFVVRSEQQLSSAMLAMRDDAYAALDAIPPGDASAVHLDAAFNAANVHDCSDPAQRLWRIVRGTFDGPYYLTGTIDDLASVPLLHVDADGRPQRAGTHPFQFDVAVPCSVLRGEAAAHPLLVGHGLFGDGAGMVRSVAEAGPLRDVAPEGIDYLVGGSDWRGLSSKDLLWLLVNLIGNPVGGHQLNNFPSFAARLQQGQIDSLVLARLMKSGFLNRLPEFQRVPGDPATGVFAGPEAEAFYFGVSLGGIMGIFHAALSPDIERFNIDVGAINFALLIQRATPFAPFEALLASVGLTDPLETVLGYSLLHEQWVTAEPAATVRHVTGRVAPPLPGSIPKKILMTVAWLDKQVSNQASEIAARSLGIPSLRGSLQARLVGIPDRRAGSRGLDSAYVVWDAGSFDVFDPSHDAVIPPLSNRIGSGVCDPHGGPRISIPASLEQLAGFLRPGGAIANTCGDDGFCNASSDEERPGGVSEAELCDPLP